MSRVEHPLIAINGLLVEGPDPWLKLSNRYAEAVLKSGGVPVAIPPVGGPSDLDRLLDRVDGLLLTGGDDFDTQRLGLGPTHPQATPVPGRKQDWDWLLAQKALERRLPVLGICYGMQLLGLVEGARILQHLPDDRPGGRDHTGNARHEVRVAPGTKLARILGVERLQVVSRHHQALTAIAGPWRVAAVDDEDLGGAAASSGSPDDAPTDIPAGLVEAIERADHPFAIGVQWHPELDEEGSPHDRLFRGLVGAAALRASAAAHGAVVPTR